MSKSRAQWLDETLSHVRFRPDHPAIRRELMDHIQDRSDELVSRGLSREAADDRTLTAMGDPAEVGVLLDAAHKPLLGWLWKVSRWLAFIAILVVLWCVFLSGMFGYWDNEVFNSNYLNPEIDTIHNEVYGEIHRTYYWEGDGKEAYWDRYTFRIEKAAVWDKGPYDLYGCLSVKGFLPWEDYLYLDEAYAMDDLGNYYPNFQSVHSGINWDVGRWLNLGWGNGRGLTTWWYGFTISGLAPEARWIDLHYDRAGQDIVLRIDLTGGEGA